MAAAEKTDNFEAFLACWSSLPRDHHPFLPSKSACTPATLGALLPQCALFEYQGKHNLQILFVGSEMERLSGLTLQHSQKNYYDFLPEHFKPMMDVYHSIVFGKACGAYVGDVITTPSGASYLFETMQFPVCDDDGRVRFLLAYGYGRKPTGETGAREMSDRAANHIRDLHYMDLGGGAPTSCIIDYEVRQ